MQFLAKLGKFTFLIGIFLLIIIWNVPGQLGIFSANWEKKLEPETGPSFVSIEKKPFLPLEN